MLQFMLQYAISVQLSCMDNHVQDPNSKAFLLVCCCMSKVVHAAVLAFMLLPITLLSSASVLSNLQSDVVKTDHGSKKSWVMAASKIIWPWHIGRRLELDFNACNQPLDCPHDRSWMLRTAKFQMQCCNTWNAASTGSAIISISLLG